MKLLTLLQYIKMNMTNDKLIIINNLLYSTREFKNILQDSTLCKLPCLCLSSYTQNSNKIIPVKDIVDVKYITEKLFDAKNKFKISYNNYEINTSSLSCYQNIIRFADMFYDDLINNIPFKPYADKYELIRRLELLEQQLLNEKNKNTCGWRGIVRYYKNILKKHI